ncbi:MAG: phosphoribosylanthranilate isomerase [Planctomycetota bacterium]
MKRTRIKFCGMTRPDDVKFAADLGVDAIGVILHAPGSTREIELSRADELFRSLPPFVARVGVFVDAPADTILDAADRLFLDYAQVHGEPSAELIHDICAVKLLLSVPVDENITTALENCKIFPDKSQIAVALDSGKVGGTGKEADWNRIADLDLDQWASVMFAGGLDPDNVADIVTRFRPNAVDVSSGIESGVRGFKDIEKMLAFVKAVRAADSANL